LEVTLGVAVTICYRHSFAKVNEALVLPDKEGKPYTVRYDAVNAMLLNEFLKEHREVQELKKQVAALTAGLEKVSAQLELSKSAPQVVNNPKAVGVGARFQRLIPTRERSGLQTLTANSES
jgi:hypothetical protein